MARYKLYLEEDVLTAARRRLHHIYDTHDTVVTMFSGGKDSLATLELTLEVEAERGLKRPHRVVFRDEELIPDEVVDFVDAYRRDPRVDLEWYCIPLASTKYILGRVLDYVQWDPDREWVRPMPEWAIRLEPGDRRVFDQYTTDAFVAKRFKGKVAFLTGIRAAESIMRFRASVNKLNQNYINASSDKRVSLCKPLYDWEENDVLRYFYDRGIRYCLIYDAQLYAGMQLRVSTPLHPEYAKRLGKLRQIAPRFYDRVLRVFPEVEVQDRYFADLDREAVKARYGQSWEGVKAWIVENIQEEAVLERALKMYESVRKRGVKDPLSYPPDHVLKSFMAGAFKREILPLNEQDKAKRREKATRA